MKTYQLAFLVETESNTDYKLLGTFTDLKIATKEFKKAVKNQPRYRQSSEDDFREYLNEAVTLELWVDDDFEDRLAYQEIYSEGIIDRKNWKGEYPVNYYSRATFNGKELMHEMYFQGVKEMWGKKHKVPQSQIKNWYYS